MRSGRRFGIGNDWSIGGVHVRVVRGHKPDPQNPTRKHPGDLRLEIETRSGWVPVKMALVGLLANFFYENEETLYPPPRYEGGKKFWRWLRLAIDDWQKASSQLEDEKDEKRRKLEKGNDQSATPRPTPLWQRLQAIGVQETGDVPEKAGSATEEDKDFWATVKRIGPP